METQIKEQLVEVAKLMYQKNMVNAFEGNLSVFCDDRVYITPSGICKGILTEEIIVTTDKTGHVLDGSYKPSSEIKLHLACYRKRRDIRAVVHAHTPFLTAYAVANQPLETKAYPEMIVFFDKFPLAAYGTQSTDEIYYGLEELLLKYDVILLANHGVVAVGQNIYDAFYKLEAAESIAKTLTIARLIGGEKDLPEDKLQELYEMRRKNHQNKNG